MDVLSRLINLTSNKGNIVVVQIPHHDTLSGIGFKYKAYDRLSEGVLLKLLYKNTRWFLIITTKASMNNCNFLVQIFQVKYKCKVQPKVNIFFLKNVLIEPEQR